MEYQVKEFRVAKGLTTDELAKKVGITRTYLSQIENGKAENISSKVLVALAHALDKKVDDMIKQKNLS